MEEKNQPIPNLEDQGNLPLNQASENSPKDLQSLLFFNVMPKDKNTGNLVNPVLKIVEENDRKPKDTKFVGKTIQIILKNKKYIYIGAGVLILALASYFIALYFINKTASQSSLVLTPAKNQNKQSSIVKSTTTPSSSLNNANQFTTSQDWRDKYFPNCSDSSLCGDSADPDHDGLSNLEENKLGTDPNNPDSDSDGLADGDEVHVFGSDPLNAHTAKNNKYTDADYIKGGFDFTTSQKLTTAQISDIGAKMQQFGLHQPTLTTIGNLLNSLYGFSAQTSVNSSTSPGTIVGTSSPTTGIDESVSAKQERDAQRSDTINKIEVALIAYQSDNTIFPEVQDFNSMFSAVKPYLKVATNPNDPINQNQFVYSYTANASGTDFALSFFSEGQNQLISKNAADAKKDAAAAQASIYDNQREMDLQSIQTALLLYSQKNIAGNQTYVFPTVDKYKTALVPTYIEAVPKDPKTGQDYQYQVAATFDSFTLKAVLDNPTPGTTGFMCNQDSCQNY